MRTKPDKPLRSPLRTLTSSPPPRNTHALRKITSQAENRMLTRTAKEQLAQAMADANRSPSDAVPDADDSAANRAGGADVIPLPFITHAIAAAVAALAAWTAQGWRMDAALADLRKSHTQAQAELTDRNAKHLHRVWERGDNLAAQLASQQTHITRVHQEHAHAIKRLTTGRACLSADLVRLLNNTQPAATDRPDPLPTPTGQPDAADAPAFATDADVSTWAATARQQYAECAARLGALIEWHGPRAE